MDCATSVRINQDMLHQLRLMGQRSGGQEQVKEVLSSAHQAISKGKAVELPANSGVFWESAAVQRAVVASGGRFIQHSGPLFLGGR